MGGVSRLMELVVGSGYYELLSLEGLNPRATALCVVVQIDKVHRGFQGVLSLAPVLWVVGELAYIYGHSVCTLQLPSS